MVFWESVFQDLLAVFILVVVFLFLYSKHKGVSMMDVVSDLKEVLK